MDFTELQKLQAELDQKEKARKPAKTQAGKTESPQTVLPANLRTHLPAKLQAGKPANPLDHKPVSEQVEKYTTRLTPSMVKRIKIYAAQQDLKDYEVVEKALLDYFERNK